MRQTANLANIYNIELKLKPSFKSLFAIWKLWYNRDRSVTVAITATIYTCKIILRSR